MPNAKDKNLTKWKRLGQKTLYQGRVHIVEFEVELPDGSSTTYEVDHSATQAVGVLIKAPNESIVVSHQYRFPLDQWIYDLPGGCTDVGEELQAAARRECREEVGIEPITLTKLISFYPNPGRSNWSATIFFCNKYREAQPLTDNPSEIVRPVLIPIKKFEKLVQQGKIIDPSLLIAWHTARSRKLL